MVHIHTPVLYCCIMFHCFDFLEILSFFCIISIPSHAV
nr:MAG TPA: hypothetical protein [Caudoviricetes sp.]